MPSRCLFGVIAGLLLMGPAQVASAGLGSPQSGPIQVQDARGRSVSLPGPAQRIVALAPHFVENLYAIGAGDRIVGVLGQPDFPAAARDLPSVGRFDSPSAESILALRPDLVLMWLSGNSPALLGQLERLGLVVFADEPRRLDAVAQSLLHLGQLTGQQPQAEALAEGFRQRRDALAVLHAEKSPVRVFYQIWHEPLQTLNGRHVVSDLIRLCGGVNVFADARVLAPRVSIEAVLAARPQAIVASGAGVDEPPNLARWKQWPQLPAVAGGHLFSIRPDWMLRFTPRMLEGAALLCQQLDRVRATRSGPAGLL